ncbi:hypothetical protein FQZ97_969880 [compost metagenome]
MVLFQPEHEIIIFIFQEVVAGIQLCNLLLGSLLDVFCLAFCLTHQLLTRIFCFADDLFGFPGGFFHLPGGIKVGILYGLGGFLPGGFYFFGGLGVRGFCNSCAGIFGRSQRFDQGHFHIPELGCFLFGNIQLHL